MDPVTDFITGQKIPVGQWGKAFFALLTTHLEWFFDSLSRGLGAVLDESISLLLLVPAPILILAIAGLAWYLQKNWRLALGTLLGLAFVLILFGLGMAPGLIVTIIFAAPAPIRLTHLGITSVPKPLIEAGEAFGATRRQLLWKVELPAALPTIMAGLTQCIMLSLSMVVIAALIGASGLGKPVVRGLNSLNIPLGIEAGLAIVVLAIILDRVCRVSGAARKEQE